MRHGKKNNSLSRTSAHRKAMLSNMACSLIEHKRINTTVAKAKALRVYLEPLLTKSKTDSTHSRRIVFKYLQSKEATTELFREISPKIADRPGGYLRIIRIGNRLGDNAEMCMIELVDFNDLMTKEPKEKKTRRSRRGGGTTNASTDANAEETKSTEKKEAKSVGDDLTKIKGIGPVYAKELVDAGFSKFEDIASLTAEDITKMSEIEGISEDRIESEEWVKQAKELVEKKAK
ncbi:50S ribosomal protein L17 [Brumimicrobium oceani]|uniref:Large ribosomal subunit protein bL17 n=1 Tax=Brumimicrobium oceani TaxID=2100725 RepID=A0A2U2XDP1_9FLAO|nr:50S ribosomal protein L17 [Brumimicrobium oceani]